jgi:hypothetical protein
MTVILLSLHSSALIRYWGWQDTFINRTGNSFVNFHFWQTSWSKINYLHTHKYIWLYKGLLDWFFFIYCTTFSNIPAISWRPVLVVEEAGVPGENHWTWTSNWQALLLALRVECNLFCNLQSWARTHAVLVIGLFEHLDPTT